jgi:hypothetical protein
MTVAYGKGIWLLTFGTSIALIGIYGLGIDWNTLRTWYSLPRMRTTEHTSYKPSNDTTTRSALDVEVVSCYEVPGRRLTTPTVNPTMITIFHRLATPLKAC